MQPSNSRRSQHSMAAMAAVLCLALCACARADTPSAPGFTLASADLRQGDPIGLRHVYDRDGCRGRNTSPALEWKHPPAGTRSYALLMFDSDAPGGGWWHWLVFDIPAPTRSLPSGAGNPAARLMPGGAIQSRNDYGSPGYGGPCPPPGAPHHYHLMLYALRVAKLHLGADPSPREVYSSVRAAAIAKAEITVLYGR